MSEILCIHSQSRHVIATYIILVLDNYSQLWTVPVAKLGNLENLDNLDNVDSQWKIFEHGTTMIA